jgi:hypothetical protein
LLHRIVEGPFADDRTSVFPPSCCCRGACRGGCFGRVGCSWGDSRELPDSGHVVMCCGPVPAMAPFPVPGLRSRLAFLLVTCAAVGCLLMAGVCLCVEDAHEKLRGRPPGDARRCLCAGFLQCGSFVEVCTVVCVSAQERGLVLVRGGGACRAVCVRLGGLPPCRLPRRCASPAPLPLPRVPFTETRVSPTQSGDKTC